MASPCGHISFKYFGGNVVFGGRLALPLWVVHIDVGSRSSCRACHHLRFWSCSRSVSAPVTKSLVESTVGGFKPSTFIITSRDVPSSFGILTVGGGPPFVQFESSFCGLVTAGQASMINIAAPIGVGVGD